MDQKPNDDLSWDEFDELRDPRPAENDFDRVVEAAISRRGFLSGVLAFGSGAMAFGTGLLTSGSARAQAAASPSRRSTLPPISTSTSRRAISGNRW